MKEVQSQKFQNGKSVKKNLQNVACFSTEKVTSLLSTIRHALTTKTPPGHHTFHHASTRTPLKNTRKHSHLRHASLFLLAATSLTAQIPTPAPPQQPQAQPRKDNKKPQREDVEWLWQYSPPPADGRETQLVLDPSFRPFLAQFLTAPQTFWGSEKTGYKSLADTALDFLSIPGKVLADENRYLTVTGSVYHFNSSRGLLWVDLNGAHHTVVFAAIDWTKSGKTPNEPDAQYTLWVFPNHPLDTSHIPAALTRSIARWTAEPPAGSKLIQHITNAIIVDPDGTPHQITPALIGANTQTEQKAQP